MIKEKENGETEIKESKTNIVKTGGKLYIAGESADIGVCAIGIYDQEMLDNLLGVDGNEEFSIYLAAVGKKS